jgi:hypothetical protein
MRLAETQELTDGELFYVISNGVHMSGMPGWGKSLFIALPSDCAVACSVSSLCRKWKKG